MIRTDLINFGARLTLAAAAFAANAASAQTVSTSRELGFVLNAFAPAVYQGKDDCPEGLAETIRGNYLLSLPVTERARLSLPANESELTKRWQAYAVGPNNTNVCANPEAFDRPLQKMFKGKIAQGLDLDGGDMSGGCAHESFTSPGGERGIDNQVYRAMGCTLNYRGVDGSAGDLVRGSNRLLATGEQSMVLLLRGVDSLADDPDVEVIFATTRDRPVLDTQQNFITGASFTVDKTPRWRNVLRGRIASGVLTTNPADIRVSRRVGQGGIRGENLDWDLRAGRFRLAFQPDGSVKGLLGAYQPTRNVIETTILGGIGAATVAGIDCAAQLATLNKLADGLPDPTTGKCTAASIGIDVSGIPAFVNDTPPAAGKVAVR